MAFLGLTDIKFKTIEKRDRLVRPGGSLSYPLNVGSTEVGHYVIFYINEFGAPSGGAKTTAQKNAEFLGASRKNNSAVADNFGQSVNNVLDSDMAKKAIQQGSDAAIAVLKKSGMTEAQISNMRANAGQIRDEGVKTTKSSAKKIFNSSQRYRRTTQTIALYMPNTLQFDYIQRYNSTSATDAMGTIGFLTQGGSTLYETGLNDNTINNMKSFLGEAAIGLFKKTGLISDDFGNIISQAAFDTAINPQVELLYSNPELRTFQFNFNFFPSSQREAESVDEIIRLFKYESAPALKENSSGRYFTPPGSFDIEFMYNGKMNINIPKISTCVLESVQVNYAPNGFSAFEATPPEQIVGKGDGMPTQITLQLNFRETEIITRELLSKSTSDGNSF